MTLLITTIATLIVQQADAVTIPILAKKAAPSAVVGDNVYIAWWTNKTANRKDEVMFRVSNDAGGTFGEKINLNNTTATDFQDVEISAD
jgi:DNA uptake protein ComE-like DNA-binding protein